MTLNEVDSLDLIQETLSHLEDAIERVDKNNTALPDCFVWAQTLDNQKEYYLALFDYEKKNIEKIRELEPKIKELHEKLFPVFDRTADSEIIDVLYQSLEILIGMYNEKFNAIGEMTDEQLIDMLTIRDTVKILFDELEVWLDKFKGKDQVFFEKKSHLFGTLKESDGKLRDELVIHNKFHTAIHEEASRRLIREPNGIKRYNFWWWHMGK